MASAPSLTDCLAVMDDQTGRKPLHHKEGMLKNDLVVVRLVVPRRDVEDMKRVAAILRTDPDWRKPETGE